MKISWIEIQDRIPYELRQLEEEGNAITLLSDEWKTILLSVQNKKQFQERAALFYQKIGKLSSDKVNKKNEPSEWDDIVQQWTKEFKSAPLLSSSFVEEKILGGWLGRSAGCLLGKPVEKIPRSGIIELLSSNGTWPIKDYITGLGIPDSLLQKYPWNRHSGKESLKENIVCMTEDDDMNYPMLNLSVLEQFGENFTTEDILQTWMSKVPVLETFTAERIAYINALNGITPPETAIEKNPYREWIGAQIRADVWGWSSPGQPARAAQFAWRDARLSHVRNGIYGEIFFASLLAECFIQSDLRTSITNVLQMIPPHSRFAAAIRFVLSMPIQKLSWDETVDELYKEFGGYHWVHTINNAALVVAALLSSNGEFEKAVCNVVMGGWDTDSNGATVGSIMGTLSGAKNLPSKWIEPLNNRIRSSIKGFDNSLLSDLAKRTAAAAKY
ncbi:MAG: ADP-ribosylglycohydrolase family protein [Bacteroidetes bacterium]|nr:ADP-ribosylglycohydrolase family protein [Bacteroidota bacterium]